MKISHKLFIAVLLLFLPSVAFSAKPEFRAAWVTAWQDGYLTPEQADKTVQAAKDANLNALFIQVRKTGDAYYNSAYDPRATNIKGGADYDPLAYIIEKAHSEGIEVHAWAAVDRVWTGKNSPSNPDHVYNTHRDWLSRTYSGSISSGEGIWLDPGNQEAQDYTVNVLLDIVRNYNIDGLQLDYIRYAGVDWGYNPAAIARFYEETGRTGTPKPSDPEWAAWRRQQVTQIVKRVYTAAAAMKPNVKISASTISWGDCPSSFTKSSAYSAVFQDWQGWMKQGILDANVIMNYKDETKAARAQSFRNWVDGAKRWSSGRHAYTGQTFSSDVSSVARQIAAAREHGADGISGFYFNSTPWRSKLVAALRASVFQETAPVPSMPWKENTAKAPGTESVSQAPVEEITIPVQ